MHELWSPNAVGANRKLDRGAAQLPITPRIVVPISSRLVLIQTAGTDVKFGAIDEQRVDAAR
jgi:hypothetical protein